MLIFAMAVAGVWVLVDRARGRRGPRVTTFAVLTLAIAAGRWDAERLLDEWRVGYVVTGGRGTPALAAVLASSGRWRLAFSHGDERVFVRAGRTAPTRPAAR